MSEFGFGQHWENAREASASSDLLAASHMSNFISKRKLKSLPHKHLSLCCSVLSKRLLYEEAQVAKMQVLYTWLPCSGQWSQLNHGQEVKAVFHHVTMSCQGTVEPRWHRFGNFGSFKFVLSHSGGLANAAWKWSGSCGRTLQSTWVFVKPIVLFTTNEYIKYCKGYYKIVIYIYIVIKII